MGIKKLNKYLYENCINSIHTLHFRELSGKTIVIDISIYLYKYKDTIIEYLYTMITCFLQYNITPVFIFDGKPPPEKYALLLLRESNKAKAEAKYNEIITKTSDHRKLDSLKNQFVRLNDTNFKQAKDLLDAYGIQHITSPTESDPLLVYLVQSGKAWACLSEDMDMFAYGCIRVCRGLNLDTHEKSWYCLEPITTKKTVTYT